MVKYDEDEMQVVIPEDMTVSDARKIFKDAIARMPHEITGWPQHVLDSGSDEDVLKFATLLKRGDD